MRVERLTERRDLDSLREIWNQLAGDNPFRSWEWSTSWWDAFNPGKLFVMVCRDETDRVVGIAPWFTARHLTLGNVIRFLGSGKACSEYQGILCTAEYANIVGRAFAHALVDAKPKPKSGWDMLELNSTIPNDPAIHELTNQLSVQGGFAQQAEAMPCWVLDLPTTFDEYLQSLDKKRRQKTRGVLRDAEGTTEVTRVQSLHELDEWFSQFVELHVRRRSSLHEDHCFEYPGFDDFLLGVGRQLIDSGDVSLMHVWVNGQIASSSFNLVKGKTCYVYQSGMNPDLSHSSPGWLMNILNIRHCIEQGITTYDLLRGDERYKAHLMARPQEAVEIRIAAPGRISKVRCQLWQTSHKVINWGQSISPFST